MIRPMRVGDETEARSAQFWHLAHSLRGRDDCRLPHSTAARRTCRRAEMGHEEPVPPTGLSAGRGSERRRLPQRAAMGETRRRRALSNLEPDGQGSTHGSCSAGRRDQLSNSRLDSSIGGS